MPTRHYLAALELLDFKHRKQVRMQLRAWSKSTSFDNDWHQISKNIRNETALASNAFSSLLKGFAEELETGLSPAESWSNVCARYRLHGRALQPIDRPSLAGRASKIDDYARFLEGEASKRANLHLLTKWAGKVPLTALRNKMRKANIGGPVTFTSFNETSGELDPFAGLPLDTSSIRIAFGLGHLDTTGRFILLSYGTGASPDLPLHRPSIADACSFSYFRPHPDENARVGRTHPLSPNPRRLKSRPELVHKQISGSTLKFPYQLTAS